MDEETRKKIVALAEERVWLAFYAIGKPQDMKGLEEIPPVPQEKDEIALEDLLLKHVAGTSYEERSVFCGAWNAFLNGLKAQASYPKRWEVTLPAGTVLILQQGGIGRPSGVGLKLVGPQRAFETVGLRKADLPEEVKGWGDVAEWLSLNNKGIKVEEL